jgi:hypothetical protein
MSAEPLALREEYKLQVFQTNFKETMWTKVEELRRKFEGSLSFIMSWSFNLYESE